MNTGKTIFAQLLEHLPLHQFRRCVQRYGGNHRVRSFSYLDISACSLIYNRTVADMRYQTQHKRTTFYSSPFVFSDCANGTASCHMSFLLISACSYITDMLIFRMLTKEHLTYERSYSKQNVLFHRLFRQKRLFLFHRLHMFFLP